MLPTLIAAVEVIELAIANCKGVAESQTSRNWGSYYQGKVDAYRNTLEILSELIKVADR